MHDSFLSFFFLINLCFFKFLNFCFSFLFCFLLFFHRGVDRKKRSSLGWMYLAGSGSQQAVTCSCQLAGGPPGQGQLGQIANPSQIITALTQNSEASPPPLQAQSTASEMGSLPLKDPEPLTARAVQGFEGAAGTAITLPNLGFQWMPLHVPASIARPRLLVAPCRI